MRAVVLAAAAAAAASILSAPPADAEWSGPIRVSSGTTLDLLPPQIALGPRGGAAVASATFDAQVPGTGSAFVATGSLRRARSLPGAREVLGLGFSPRSLDMVVGLSQPGMACCYGAALVSLARGHVTSPRPFLTGLTGDAAGRLLETGSGALAVLATRAGLWVARGPGRVRVLTDKTAHIHTFDATSMPGGASATAWVNTEDPNTARRVVVARGRRRGLPGRGGTARTIAAGHTVDGLVIAAGTSGPTLGWAEGWTDGAGAFHSAVVLADYGARARVLSSRRMLASSLSLAADSRGDQIATWNECPRDGSGCIARYAWGAAGSGLRFSRLGRIDAGAAPQVAMGPAGEAVIGWIRGGRVVVRTRNSLRAPFGPLLPVSHGTATSNLSLAFGPAGTAIAAWTQGSAVRSIYASIYRNR